MTDVAAIEIGVWRLYARYSDALWRKDTESFTACFAGDAVWTIAGGTFRGSADSTTTARRTSRSPTTRVASTGRPRACRAPMIRPPCAGARRDPRPSGRSIRDLRPRHHPSLAMICGRSTVVWMPGAALQM